MIYIAETHKPISQTVELEGHIRAGLESNIKQLLDAHARSTKISVVADRLQGYCWLEIEGGNNPLNYKVDFMGATENRYTNAIQNIGRIIQAVGIRGTAVISLDVNGKITQVESLPIREICR